MRTPVNNVSDLSSIIPCVHLACATMDDIIENANTDTMIEDKKYSFFVKSALRIEMEKSTQ